MPQNTFVGDVARHYDAVSHAVYDPDLLAATVTFLAAEARGGRALELAVGTGRVALPLAAAGVEVHGIDISVDMVDQLRAKPGADAIGTTVGDMASTVVGDDFSLVYVVYNSITNLLEQHEWVATFRNAARHLSPGGRFVMELVVPELRRFPPGASAIPFDVGPQHLGFDTIDTVTQTGVSHHWYATGDGTATYLAGSFRYAWPAELDLMGELAGMRLVGRFADWTRAPFTAESTSTVSVWELAPA